jgi:hypothetical protein
MAVFEGGDFSNVHFVKTKLPKPVSFHPASLKNADLDGAEVESEDYIDNLSKNGIAGFNAKDWKIIRNDKIYVVSSVAKKQSDGRGCGKS